MNFRKYALFTFNHIINHCCSAELGEPLVRYQLYHFCPLIVWRRWCVHKYRYTPNENKRLTHILIFFFNFFTLRFSFWLALKRPRICKYNTVLSVQRKQHRTYPDKLTCTRPCARRTPGKVFHRWGAPGCCTLGFVSVGLFRIWNCIPTIATTVTNLRSLRTKIHTLLDWHKPRNLRFFVRKETHLR